MLEKLLTPWNNEWEDFKCDVLDHELLNHKVIDRHCDEDIELLLDEQHLRSKNH